MKAFLACLVFGVIACNSAGSGQGGVVDAGGADVDTSVPFDAPVTHHCDPNTPEGPVTVWNNQPGLVVLSHDATGAFLHRVDNATYATQIDVPGCGAITVGFGAGLNTFTGVQPGDTIWATYPRNHPEPPYMVARIAIDQTVPDTDYYLASAAGFCNGYLVPGTSTELSLNYGAYCVRPDGTSTVLVLATKSDPGPQVPVFAVFEDVSLAQTAQTPLHVTSWQTPPTHHLTAILNAAAPGIAAQWSLAPVSRGYTYDPWVNSVNTSGATFDLDLQYAEFGDAVSSRIKIFYGGGGSRTIEQTLATPLPAQVTAMLDTQLLPIVHDPMRDDDPVRPTLSWTVDSTVVDEDLVRAFVPTSVAGRSGSWGIVAPPGTRSLRLPEVPPDLRVHFYAAPTNVAVALEESTDVPDYQEARQNSLRFDWAIPQVVSTGTIVRKSAINFE